LCVRRHSHRRVLSCDRRQTSCVAPYVDERPTETRWAAHWLPQTPPPHPLHPPHSPHPVGWLSGHGSWSRCWHRGWHQRGTAEPRQQRARRQGTASWTPSSPGAGLHNRHNRHNRQAERRWLARTTTAGLDRQLAAVGSNPKFVRFLPRARWCWKQPRQEQPPPCGPLQQPFTNRAGLSPAGSRRHYSGSWIANTQQHSPRTLPHWATAAQRALLPE
jgi:hypothetical protein